MMTHEHAKRIVMDEALGEEGAIVLIRHGYPPSHDRMTQLLLAIETLLDSLKGKKEMNRYLAYALFALAFYIHGDVDGGLHGSVEWPDDFLDRLPHLYDIIEQALGRE